MARPRVSMDDCFRATLGSECRERSSCSSLQKWFLQIGDRNLQADANPAAVGHQQTVDSRSNHD